MANKAIDLTGQRFGRLTVVCRNGIKNKAAAWKCLCDCGNEKTISGTTLRSGASKSCGCLCKELSAQRGSNRWGGIGNPKHNHGMAGTIIHKKWKSIVQRCTNPKNSHYHLYGGCGVKICDEWRYDFQVFYDYVSKLPHFGEKGRSIDRFPNKRGNYEPGNVRWATDEEQARNQNIQYNNKTGVSGVHWDKKEQTYVVRFYKDGKRKRIGHSKDLNEAIRIRREAEMKYWGHYKE